MRLHLLLFKVLLCVLLPIAASSSPTGDVNPSRISHLSSLTPRWDDFQTSNRPASRCLLSTPGKKETALIATLDGTISLVERYTMKVLWSFYSGPSIYSSYQAPVKQENDKGNASGLSSSLFFDYGDDWELYMHNRHLGEKVKLAMPIEDIIKSTPQILEDGGVMLGSKKTTVFLVDAKTGRLINTYKSSDDEKGDLYNKDIEEWVEPDSPKPFPLYITRIDYSLQAFAPNSGKVLWNMTVSEIGAALFCPDTLNSFGGAPLLAGYELGSGLDGHLNMPLPCQSKALVIRLRGNNMAEFLSRPDSLPATSGKETILPDPAQSHLLPLPDTHEDLMPLSPASELSLSTQPKLAGLSTKSQKILPASSSELMLSSELQLHKPSDCNDDNKLGLSLSSQSSEMFAKGFTAVILIVICVGFIYCCHLLGKQETDFNQQPGCLDGKSEPSKKKRTRKLGKKNSNVEQKDKIESPVKEDNFANIENDNKVWLNHNKLLGGVLDGRRVGKLFVFNEEIAKGSNGTVVLQGNYDGRPVAVKRLVQAHHDVALKEIQNLIASDQHPNIVRWFGVEYDQDFVYLSLERCTCSLNDLILAYSDSSQNYVFHEDQRMRPMIEHKAQLDLVKNIMPDIKLWKSNGCPSPLLLKLMRDVVSGLVHLHELGIVHRDLKPQNVLISKERSLCAKLSDMGISKRLPEDMSSLGYHATGYGSSGWQAPEQLLHGRQTRSVDMFSLGCVLFFCMTGGRHPFGDRLERDINIVKNQVDLFLVEYIPEAVDLFSRLLDANPELRPKAEEVLCHPLFWNSEMRLSFLRDTSDRVELEDRETNSELLKALESTAPIALGAKWDEKMEVAFIANIGHYRRYKFDSVRDLLRVMRNKLNHYRELPKDIQGILGSVPEGFDGYFASRFPNLLIEVYKVVHRYCKDEECFKKYFDSCVI